jgi:hypothetical protein
MSDDKLRDVVVESLVSPMRLLLKAQEAERRKCWLDGNLCPYGYPNGMYNDRPTIFCKIGICARLSDDVAVSLIPDRSHICNILEMDCLICNPANE